MTGCFFHSHVALDASPQGDDAPSVSPVEDRDGAAADEDDEEEESEESSEDQPLA